jgi:hypothetical protein
MFSVWRNDGRRLIAVMDIYAFYNDGVIKTLNALQILMQ